MHAWDCRLPLYSLRQRREKFQDLGILSSLWFERRTALSTSSACITPTKSCMRLSSHTSLALSAPPRGGDNVALARILPACLHGHSATRLLCGWVWTVDGGTLGRTSRRKRSLLFIMLFAFYKQRTYAALFVPCFACAHPTA